MTDNKLKDNEIIKALECCCKNNNCEGCPLDYLTFSSQCASELAIKSLDLINRQKAEIERLKGTVIRELSDGCKKCQHNSVCNEIENLRCRNEFIWYQAESGCPHFRANDKAEAYKEFAYRLKAIASQGFWESDGYVGAEQIDALLKETVGDSNE